jgi:hypothetical protein
LRQTTALAPDIAKFYPDRTSTQGASAHHLGKAGSIQTPPTASETVIKFSTLNWRSRQAKLYELDLPL